MPAGLTGWKLTHLGRLRLVVDIALWRIRRRWPQHEAILKYALQSGRRTRPIATLLAAESAGGGWRHALPVAVAIELAHRASVIRDDLADGDEYRRGKVTFHKRFGVPLAVAVSDVLWSTSLAQLTPPTLQPEVSEQCLPLFVRAYHQMATGQLDDLRLNDMPSLSVDDLLHVNYLKTGSLGELAFRVGAIAGGGTEDRVESLAHVGRNVASAFQILNDVNNLVGNEVSRGRPVATDLRDGKHNLLVAYGWALASSQLQRRIAELMRPNETLSEDEVTEMRDILLSLHVHDHCEELAYRLLRESRETLTTLPPSTARGILLRVAMEQHFHQFAF